MKTDIPLKRLTRLVPTDLLPLLGEVGTTVLGVESLELPASARSLDTLLRLQRPGGTPYLHLIAWQGWRDPVLLWRTLSYLGWLGEHRRERPILATVIYLKPGDDVGDRLEQQVAGVTGWNIQLPCVRLWEQDAVAAVASGAPGLLALAPLMRGATGDLVETAAQTLLRTTEPPLQGEVLAALGIFAEPIFPVDQCIRLVTKERLMSTDLITYLLQDTVTEFEQERARWRTALQQSIEDVIIARFPTAPAILTRALREIQEPAQLQALHRAVLSAPDLAEVERLITTATQPSPGA
ncbi:MAG: hypothetical protein HC828_04730 [Blastochloris sp.]|nr:hypothetical protein [Blastochloris sp.]